MKNPATILQDWSYDPPSILVVGEGPYSRAFAEILSAPLINQDLIASDPLHGLNGKSPRLLDSLNRVFVIISPNRSLAEIGTILDSIWKWVIAFTKDEDEHELAVQFILPPNVESNFPDVIGYSLSLPSSKHEANGYGVSNMTNGLTEILAMAGRIHPRDFVALRNRRKTDTRRNALELFRAAVLAGDDQTMKLTAISVCECFLEKEYLLDAFCRPPVHPNGNQLRKLLNQLVTEAVTPCMKKSLPMKITDILI